VILPKLTRVLFLKSNGGLANQEILHPIYINLKEKFSDPFFEAGL
jgi:hypothetical protein